MSIHGTIGRRLTVLEIDWYRSIHEDRLELRPGWVLVITLPWVEVQIQDYGWSVPPWRRLRRGLFYKDMISLFGYEIGWHANNNTPRRYASGDADQLLEEDSRKKLRK